VHARFYAPDVRASGELVSLSSDESAHLTRVLRLKTGAAVRAFDGRGHEFEAVVDTASSRGVRLRIGEAREPAPERRTPVTLIQAVLKGDKMDEVVRDATTLGVAAIQPMVSARCATSIAALERGRRRDRWTRVAVSAAKQCGRAVVPAVLQARSIGDVLGALTATEQEPALMFVEPGAGAGQRLHDVPSSHPRRAAILIGPEGGWHPDEIAAACQRCRMVTLQGPTLRADAVAVVALTALLARWGEF
jgi:16S rRNA (uracil1498-N3)-methyltransferase